jgi:hypothetical protein
MSHAKVLLCFLVVSLGLPLFAQVPTNFTGDFQSELRFSAGQSPTAVAIGDLNGDGHADLVVADYNGNSVSVLLGNGDGTFGNPTMYSTGDYPAGVVIADVNGDGHLDIVSVNLNLDHLTLGGTVSVLIGKGDGTFVAPVNYVAGKNLSSVVVGDFNGDGHPDIAATDVASGNVAVLLNKGDGTFQTATPYAAGPNPLSMGSADLNGDGKLDLVVTNVCDVSQENFICTSQQTTISVLLGNGDGTFAAPATYPAGTGPFSLVIRDFNADGKQDIAVNNVSLGAPVPGSISILLGNGDGTFQAPTSYATDGYTLGVGDFNADGSLDLIEGSSNGLTEILGNTNGRFDPAVKYFVPLNLSGFPNIAVGDLNGDGRPDVVIPDQNTIDVFLNAGAISRQTTSVTLISSQNPIQALSPLTMTASITPTGTVLQGSVTFYVDGQTLFEPNPPTSPLLLGQPNSSNQATCCPSNLTLGTHTIEAIYSGDTTTKGSVSNTVMQTVIAIPTTMTLVSTLNPSLTGQNVTFTATVSSPGFIPQDGTVTFLDGTTVLGIVPVVPILGAFSRYPSVSLTNLAVGTHSITAAYGSSLYLAPSVSAALQQVVNGNLNLAVASGGSSSVTVPAGKPAAYVLTIGGAGFSGQTTLTCNGAPMGASCSITPASLLVSATSAATLNVSVTTTSRTSATITPSEQRTPWLWAVLFFGLLVLPLTRTDRRFGPTSLLLMCAVFTGIAMCSCGGSGGGGSSINLNGTPAGTYNLSVVATGGSANQTIPLTLTVQ